MKYNSIEIDYDMSEGSNKELSHGSVKRVSENIFVYRPKKHEMAVIDCIPSKECDEYHKRSCIQINIQESK